MKKYFASHPTFKDTHQIIIVNGSLQKDFKYEIQNIEIENLFILNDAPEKVLILLCKSTNYQTHVFSKKHTEIC